MKNLRTLAKHHLVKGSFIVFLGSGIVSFLNYLYHLISGRLLLPDQYGLLQSFISLIYFAGVFTGPLALSIINLISSAKETLVWPTIIRLEKKLIKISFIFWFSFLFLFPVFKTILHLKNFAIFFIFSWQIFFSFLAVIYQAVFQAKLKFLEFSLLGIAASLIKIIFAWLFIFLGWQTGGALAGLVFSTIGMVFLGRFWTASLWRKEAKKTITINIGYNFWQYSFLILITNLALTSLYSTDILLVRYYFPSFQAGVYSATSVLGKIILFAGGSIFLVAFPLFVKFKNNFSKLRLAFILSFLFLSTICISTLVIYNLFPKLIVSLLYGKGYSEATFFLPRFAFFIFLFAIFNLSIQLLLALENNFAAWLAGLTAISQVVLIIIRHSNLRTIISNSIISLSFGLLLGLFFVNKVINETKR